jgi:hypothetical protein
LLTFLIGPIYNKKIWEEEQIKVKSPGKSERHFIVGRGKSIIL